MEIERKFLIGQVPSLKGLTPHIIKQGYISVSPDIRIRKDNDGYYITMKGQGLMCREEYTLVITAEEFQNLRSKCEKRWIEKVRYCLPLESGEVAEIDRYTGVLSGLDIVEVEFETETKANSFIPPSWFSLEVTEDMSYRNSTLALKGKPKTS